ncbi:MAG: DUF5704 domain-containing protein [Velocimicrobium sp.]
MKYSKYTIILLFSIFVFSSHVYASDSSDVTLDMDASGLITITAPATTASTNTTWQTMGFMIHNKDYDNMSPQKPYGKILLTDEELTSTDDVDPATGITTTTFRFQYETVEDKFENADISSATLNESGGGVWFSGILRANYANGTYSSFKYCYDDIANISTVDWPDYVKKDMKNRYNIPLRFFPPANTRVYLTTMKYSSSNGYTQVSSVPLSKTERVHTTFATNTSTIPGTITSEVTKNKLYLYRVYWARLKEDKHEYSQGTYRKPRDKLSIDSSINPNTNWEGYKDALYPLRNRKDLGSSTSYVSTDKYALGCNFYEIVSGGIEIVCVYKNYKIPDTDEDKNEDYLYGDIEEPYTTATIQADDRFNEKFNSEQGIPTTERQYVCAYADEYLLQYTFVHYSGWKEFLQLSGSTYVVAKRAYSYWKIEDLNVYSLSYVRASNYSLPNSSVYLTPTSYYTVPSVNYQVYSSNLVEPVGGGTSVGEYTVWNDSLTFNGEVIMDSTHCFVSTTAPKKMPESGRANAYALYQSRNIIDATKANGEYGSEGVICYVRTTHYGDDAEGTSVTYDIDDINDVTIHTPVICDAKIEDVRKYNQLITPDSTVASLVLDTYFDVTVPTYGYHSTLTGYGTRDYAKYTASREVKFPFDVMKDGNYIAAGTWTTTGTDITYYLPVWVEEGQYTVEFRSRSINCNANNGITKTEDLANTDFENYVATDTVDVEVSGRVYNLNIYDVSDYPIWQNVFRKTNSLAFTGVNYTVGTKDRNGNDAIDWTKTAYRNSKYTLPLMNGSHPSYSTIGAVKPGYYTRFSVDTIGNYDGVDDYIRIVPQFYFVNENGKNREEVDLYYTQTQEASNKRDVLVKVGSERDQKNIHSLNRRDPYLTGTGNLKGNTCTNEIQKNVYTLGNIMIPDVLMSYIGATSYYQSLVETNNSNFLFNQNNSVQTWICEYYIPSNLHVCRKNYDVASYAINHRGLSFYESFWRKKGYLIVNFQIETIQNKERHLSYMNTQNAEMGYCNMWKLEGGASLKEDVKGVVFLVQEGDYVMYEIAPKKVVTYDYRAAEIY